MFGLRGVALTLVIASTAIAVPTVKSNWCLVSAWATEISSFGRNGSHGSTGRNGQDGRSGPSQTVFADGTPQQFRLIGDDGRDGERGDDGERPYCDSQPRDVRHDLQAASGGDGGDGGNGGNGGSGGSLTVYYTDPAKLAQIFVDARGGEGGRGGSPGRGAYGCRCDDRDWEVTTCTGTPGAPDYSCKTDRFVCRDGDSGRTGMSGRDGAPGALGRLIVVQQATPLAPENPTQTLAVADLTNRAIALSKNLWQTRFGARSLLAPGSNVADDYQAYVGRAEGRVRLDWQAPRPASRFATDLVTTQIQDDGSASVTFPEHLWVEGSSTREGDLTTYTVSAVVRAADVTRLALGRTDGRSQDFQIAVLDLAGESDYLNTQFYVKYESTDQGPHGDRPGRYSTRYDGLVPADLVTRDQNRFTLSLGRLPIGSQHFRSGTYGRLEIRIVRSLGGRSAEQRLEWNGRI